ncbi:UNVERIFIED_ORG: NlpC/P60 family protein [Anoxybacillus amylolyticus]
MGKKRKHKWILAGLSCLLVMYPLTGYAAPQEPRAQTATQQDALLQRMELLEQQIQQKDARIIEKMDELDRLNVEIEKKKTEWEAMKTEAEAAEQAFLKWKAQAEQRLRLLQEHPLDWTLMDVLFSSEGISDFVQKVASLSILMKADQQWMESLKEKSKELETKRNELEKQYNALRQMYEKMEKDKETIEREKREIESRLRSLEMERQALESRFASDEHARPIEEEVLQEQADLIEGVDETPLLNEGMMNVASQHHIKKLFSTAYKQLGVPYRWGGTTPKGFDCSGFLQYVYRSIGIHLPRTAKQQQKVGISVPKAQAKPGDLVFWGKPAYHVGLYLGNGKYIHAPRTGDVVKISKINWSSVSTVKRVISHSPLQL